MGRFDPKPFRQNLELAWITGKLARVRFCWAKGRSQIEYKNRHIELQFA